MVARFRHGKNFVILKKIIKHFFHKKSFFKQIILF